MLSPSFNYNLLHFCLVLIVFPFIHLGLAASEPLSPDYISTRTLSQFDLVEAVKAYSHKLKIKWFSVLNQIDPFKLQSYKFLSKNSFAVTLLLIFIPSYLYLNRHKEGSFCSRLLEMMSNYMNGNGSGIARRRLGFGKKNRSVDDETLDDVLKKGGNIGGLVNDGNTCFMNSVLQSLASSNTLLEFIEDSKVDDFEQNEPEKRDYDFKFTKSFRLLLQKLNSKHLNKSHDYKTTSLLRNMTKSPNKNFLMGYNQEDAQEFFQSLLFELEDDFKKINNISKENNNNNDPLLIHDLPEDAIFAQKKLGSLGDVYIQAGQIDPNLSDSDNKVFRYRLLTPVDGLTAERIGCIKCGEMGGIRYNVFSGLSLNLPTNNYTALKLSDLLKDWIEPEIIEGVDCNRCALNHVLEYQKAQLEDLKNQETSTPKLISLFEKRIKEITEELTKSTIDDRILKKLLTDNMIKKSSKSKQILISRPPPLLSIHINRSVFDPETYRVRKNNARVLFPLKFDLDQFVAGPDEINTDARFAMSKKEPKVETEEEEEISEDSTESTRSFSVTNGRAEKGSLMSKNGRVESIDNTNGLQNQEDFDSDSDADKEDSDSDADEEDSESSDEEPSQPQRVPAAVEMEARSGGPLVYQLRSVIVHYGTHNYGHYIAFRKFRGVWWRTSDEDIEIVNEEEVLSTPGVFMLFYELDSLSDELEKKKDIQDDEELPVEVELIGNDEQDENEQNGAIGEEPSYDETMTDQSMIIANL